MVNGIGVVGWGVGGIEAEAAMLGQPVIMLIPRVVGFKLNGDLPEGATATDLVLTITEMLRKHGVVGKFVEFYGPGVSVLPLANRATIGNMSPEFGSTIAVFPIDEETIKYLELTGRTEEQLALVEAYAKEQGLWHDPDAEPRYSEKLELDLPPSSRRWPARSARRTGSRSPTPRSPSAARSPTTSTTATRDERGRVRRGRRGVLPGLRLAVATTATATAPPQRLPSGAPRTDGGRPSNPATVTLDGRHEVRARPRRRRDRRDHVVHQHLQPVGDDRRRAAGQEGRREGPDRASRGSRPRWRPGSKVVSDYYEKAGLTPYLDKLGFNLVGYGCTTCIGNSGPLIPEVSEAVNDNDLAVVSVLSGNRNFEGRINPDVKMNYLASPPLVVAYALAGSMDVDLFNDPLGQDTDGNDVFMKDIWPTAAGDRGGHRRRRSPPRCSPTTTPTCSPATSSGSRCRRPRATRSSGTRTRPTSASRRTSTACPTSRSRSPTSRAPGCCSSSATRSPPTTSARPARSRRTRPPGKYLAEHGVEQRDFNSYGSRRGNHEVMIRGTFANIRLRNQLAPGTEGGFTRDFTGDGEVTTVFEASENYLAAGHPAGGPGRQGVRLRLVARLGRQGHRAAGRQGRDRRVLRADPPLQPDRHGRAAAAVPRGRDRRVAGPHRRGDVLDHRRHRAQRRHHAADGQGHGRGDDASSTPSVRIDTPGEANYYRNGGIMQYVLRNLRKKYPSPEARWEGGRGERGGGGVRVPPFSMGGPRTTGEEPTRERGDAGGGGLPAAGVRSRGTRPRGFVGRAVGAATVLRRSWGGEGTGECRGGGRGGAVGGGWGGGRAGEREGGGAGVFAAQGSKGRRTGLGGGGRVDRGRSTAAR